MFKLSKATAKVYIQKYLNPFMQEHGFIEKKRRDMNISYKRNNNEGFEGLELGMIESFPGQIIRYSVFKRINIIEKITDDILVKIEPERKSNKESLSMAFGYSTIYNTKTDRNLPEMENEEDVQISVGLIRQFLTTVAFPMLEKYSDIKELDKTINGNDFWEDDWQKPFNLGSQEFYVKRLVIAKLANQGNFERTVELTYEMFDALCREQNKPLIERNNLNHRIPYAIHYLNHIMNIS